MLFFGKKKKIKKAEELKKQEAERLRKEQERLKNEELARRIKIEEEKKQREENQKEIEKKEQEQKKTEKKVAVKPLEEKKETKTVASKKGPSGKYEIYPEAGMYKYRLKASNGEILAVSFGYSTKKGAENGIETFKKNVETGIFELSTDKSNYSFYTLFNSTGARAVVIGEFYNTLKQAESAVESVKNFYKTNKITLLNEIPKSEIREEVFKIGKIDSNPNGKYEVFKDGKNWFVRLRASNSEILFYSQGYSSKSNALKGLETIKNGINDGNFTVAKDKQNRYQFKLYSSRKQLILSGETYPVKRSCTSAIESVVRFSKKAKVIEL